MTSPSIMVERILSATVAGFRIKSLYFQMAYPTRPVKHKNEAEVKSGIGNWRPGNICWVRRPMTAGTLIPATIYFVCCFFR